MKTIQLLMPMSGKGSRFKQAGYNVPKPLIPVNGVPMVQRMLKLFPINWPSTFVLSKSDEESGLNDLLLTLRPDAKIIDIEPHSEGPGRAIEAALPLLDPDLPVLISYCDFGMAWDANEFEAFAENTQCDACVVSYRGFHAHYLSPQAYAYSRIEGDWVKQVKEKGSFTEERENEFASAGAYYFSSAKLLAQALKKQKELALVFNHEYYTSLTVEALLQLNPSAKVNVFEVPYFFQWGTPADLKDFEYWEHTYRWQNKFKIQNKLGTFPQILMPMAGRGSRFAELFPHIPKPFLEWNGEPMFKKALDCFPRSEKNVFVLLNDHKKFFEAYKGAVDHAIYLKETPAGQALSVEVGLPALTANQEVIVTACDHGLVLAPEVWRAFKSLATVDAAIFTTRGFPGTRRNPTAFAYVECEDGSDFSKVKKVSVKQAISDHPEKDPLLVGSFWFKDPDILRDAIFALKKSGEQVNGEYYLDAALNHLIQKGLEVRQIPLESYIGWGDPDSLAEALYWEEVYNAPSPVSESPRHRFRSLS